MKHSSWADSSPLCYFVYFLSVTPRFHLPCSVWATPTSACWPSWPCSHDPPPPGTFLLLLPLLVVSPQTSSPGEAQPTSLLFSYRLYAWHASLLTYSFKLRSKVFTKQTKQTGICKNSVVLRQLDLGIQNLAFQHIATDETSTVKSMSRHAFRKILWQLVWMTE